MQLEVNGFIRDMEAEYEKELVTYNRISPRIRGLMQGVIYKTYTEILGHMRCVEKEIEESVAQVWLENFKPLGVKALDIVDEATQAFDSEAFAYFKTIEVAASNPTAAEKKQARTWLDLKWRALTSSTPKAIKRLIGRIETSFATIEKDFSGHGASFQGSMLKTHQEILDRMRSLEQNANNLMLQIWQKNLDLYTREAS